MEGAQRRLQSIQSHLEAAETSAKKEITVDDFKKLVGKELGTSKWMEVTQQRVNAFAEATGDHQWIHVDVEKAKNESPFGGTIAHGFLTLSLLPMLSAEILPNISGIKMGINYGINKARFVSPVLVGSKIRAKVALQELAPVKEGIYQSVLKVTMEIENNPKPAAVIEWVVMYYV